MITVCVLKILTPLDARRFRSVRSCSFFFYFSFVLYLLLVCSFAVLKVFPMYKEYIDSLRWVHHSIGFFSRRKQMVVPNAWSHSLLLMPKPEGTKLSRVIDLISLAGVKGMLPKSWCRK